MSIKKALLVTTQEMDTIRQYHHVDQVSIQRDVAILREWVRQEQHLPDDISDNLIERFLLRNKFQIQQAKCKIDAYFSIRGQYLEFYRGYKQIVPSKEAGIAFYLPRLTPMCHRVLLGKILDPNPENYDTFRILVGCLLMAELSLPIDYHLGLALVIDLQGFSMEHVKKFDLALYAKALRLMQRAYSGKITSVNYVNASPSLGYILHIVRTVAGQKIFGKVQVHDDLASLHKVVPKQCLPKDYGGDLDESIAIIEKWDRIFEENHEFFEENLKNVTDESVRIGEIPYNEMFGVDGTFRQIKLD